MKKLTLLAIICSLSFQFISAQQLDHVLGDVLIKIEPKTNIRTLVADLQTFEQKTTKLAIKKSISTYLNIWLLSFDFNNIHEKDFLNQLRKHPDIEIAQFNHLVDLRSTTPDDAGFAQQWQYINDGSNSGTVGADIDMDLAWDISTGGMTANSDEIVVCIIDNGFDPTHTDFGDNLWVNVAEIPDNGIDDDDNGFVDDYEGWNTSSDDDNLDDANWHGTPVAGIIGAQGNNGTGVAGVNWDVKLMIVVGGTGLESEVLEAYSYPLSFRAKYNQTNGAEGAFVVSTNASWGVTNGQPANAPLWCAYYDELGQAGILNCGATANANSNIDVNGDLPTACPSDFMISVTNMNRNDNKVTNAGYGLTTIDLGAFGAETWTVANNNSYDFFEGTSGATPHVAGTIALMYAAPCPTLASLALSHPEQAARDVRQYLFDGLDANASLDGITVTGGRLNAFNSMQLVVDNCDAATQTRPKNINICPPNDAVFTVKTRVFFEAPMTLSATGYPAGTSVTFGTNPVTPGQSTSMTVSNTNAADIGTYTIQIAATDGMNSGTEDITLTLLGTTSAPSLDSPAHAETDVPTIPTLTWIPSSGAATYTCEIASDMAFNTIIETGQNLTSPIYNSSNRLMAVSTYYWRVRSSNLCGESTWSVTRSFETANVSCNSYSSDNDPITISATAATPVSSVINITDIGTVIEIIISNLIVTHSWVGDLYITLTSPTGTVIELINRPGSPASVDGCSQANINISLDDNVINTANDLENTCNSGGTYTIQGIFKPITPLSNLNGEDAQGDWTLTVDDQYPSGDGGSLDSWELDICIANASILPIEQISFTAQTTKSAVALAWSTATENNHKGFELERSLSPNQEFKKIAWITGKGNSSSSTTYVFDDKNIQAMTTYYYRLKQIDQSGNFSYSNIISATTLVAAWTVRLIPNITSDVVTLDFLGEVSRTHNTAITIINTQGQSLKTFVLNHETTSYTLDFSDFSKGLYFVHISNAADKVVKKILVK